ncbi:hypothetical protein ACQUQP_11330 [Marinobacterium sp. YM272]|uniref:hypothetical protein n=1 Tax=Marinobacterium sp. YM272 TaxID=3421654 RepID=UPI003D7F327A
MTEQKRDVKTGEWLPGKRSTASRELQRPIGFNPLQPWAAMLPWLRLEYLKIELSLEDDQIRVRGEHGRFEDGLHASEQVEACIPAELCLEAAERIQLQLQQQFQQYFQQYFQLQSQQQMQTMMQSFMLPWTAMMFPFWQKD